MYVMKRLCKISPAHVPYVLVSVMLPAAFVDVTTIVCVAPIPDGICAAIDDSECQNVASEAVLALRICIFVCRKSVFDRKIKVSTFNLTFVEYSWGPNPSPNVVKVMAPVDGLLDGKIELSTEKG